MPEFPEGTKVNHLYFGHGIVCEVYGDSYLISFRNDEGEEEQRRILNYAKSLASESHKWSEEEMHEAKQYLLSQRRKKEPWKIVGYREEKYYSDERTEYKLDAGKLI